MMEASLQGQGEARMAQTMDKGVARQEEWPQSLKDEFQRSQQNGCVGTELVSETDRVRVWMIRLAPGERIGFHRHVLDYFWTARSEEHTSELQSRQYLVCRLLLEKKKKYAILLSS